MADANISKVEFQLGQRVVRLDSKDLIGTVVGTGKLSVDCDEKAMVTVMLVRVDILGPMILCMPCSVLRPYYDGVESSSWKEFERICGWSPNQEKGKPSRKRKI